MMWAFFGKSVVKMNKEYFNWRLKFLKSKKRFKKRLLLNHGTRRIRKFNWRFIPSSTLSEI